MKANPMRRSSLLAAALGLAALGCGGAGSASGNASTNALASAYAASSAASGTLLCTPSDAQTAACSGMAAGAACTLTSTSGSTIDGTCRTTIDGTGVACAPNPPAPPPELVTPCANLTAGAACTVTEEFGETRAGVCLTARDGTTLICGRVHMPSQGAIDACTGKAVGDTCTKAEDDMDDAVASHDGAGETGVCSMGPGGTGPLACAPVHSLLPHGAEACAGLSTGAACTMGHEDDQVSGTCMAPAGETTLVCVVACADLHGTFDCRSDGPGHPGGPGPHGG